MFSQMLLRTWHSRRCQEHSSCKTAVKVGKIPAPEHPFMSKQGPQRSAVCHASRVGTITAVRSAAELLYTEILSWLAHLQVVVKQRHGLQVPKLL
jgi:hypothetical protein